MNFKPTSRRYLALFFFVFLIACGKQAATLPEGTSTPISVPTFTPTSASTSTSTPFIISSTLIPLQTPTLALAITADSIQVERWQEYEDALAKALFRLSFVADQFLCEW